MSLIIKSFLLLTMLATLTSRLSAQQVYKINADSTLLTGCDSNELIIENHTQNVPGFLFNTGRGRTIFKRGSQKLNDSLYLIGADTLRVPFHPWLQGGNSFASTGILGTLDSNHLNFYSNNRQQARLTAIGNWLIGSSTDNGSKLQVTGNTSLTGSLNVSGSFTATLASSNQSVYNPSLFAGPSGGTIYGVALTPAIAFDTTFQVGSALYVAPTFKGNSLQQSDLISSAATIKSRLGGITILQDSSMNTFYNTGQPLFIWQTGTANKEAIFISRLSTPNLQPFIWNRDTRSSSNNGAIVPALRSTIGTPTAGGGVSFTLDRYYFGTDASINLLYETTPTDSTVITSMAFNTSTLSGRATPLYIKGANVGFGTKTPSAQFHTTGTVRFAGLTSDSTQTRVLVSDASGNLFYRSVSSLAAEDILRSSLAVNGPIKAKSLTLKESDWPDYVFDSSYQLPALDEVENYIRRQHHLPGIPSAAETSDKGIDVGANQAVLLKKIEELTLYTIVQEKELNSLNKKIAAQDKQIEELKNLILNRSSQK